jgi:hypothetical protein
MARASTRGGVFFQEIAKAPSPSPSSSPLSSNNNNKQQTTRGKALARCLLITFTLHSAL